MKKSPQVNLATKKVEPRRNSCPDPKMKPKKLDRVMLYKNGSTQNFKHPANGSKEILFEASPKAESTPHGSEMLNIQTHLPKPEMQPKLENTFKNHENHTLELEEVDMGQIDEDYQESEQIYSRKMTEELQEDISVPKPTKGGENIWTESDEEDKHEEINNQQSQYRKFGIEDLPQELIKFSNTENPLDAGRTLNIEQIRSKETHLNSPHSSKSTIIIAESPRENEPGLKNKDKNTRETQDTNDTQIFELKDTQEPKFSNLITTDATKAIENVIVHDGPLIQPKPIEVCQANIANMRNKLNLEIYLKVENLLYAIKENIMAGKPIFKHCRDYIEVAPKIDRENFEKIVKTEAEKKIIKSSFILKRMGVILMLYFTVENMPNEKVMFQLKNIINIIHQNFIILGYFISLKLKNKSISNAWIPRLFELLEYDSSSNFTKSENLDKMTYNNTYLCNTMKNLIVTMRNKEILYAFNSIAIQLDRISIKEAYTRLLKSFSVFMSEKELKTQVGQHLPKKMLIAKKLKHESKKEEIVFLPKLSGHVSEFTLVVDLDETLVHYAEIPGKLNELRVRPYASYFLSEVSKYYEIVVFTAAMQEYADWVLDNIDKDHHISHRLYRQHASPDGYNFVKDLSKIGRELTKTIIVDNLAENFRLQPDNGIYIKPWYDDHEDTALLELAPLLIEIAKKKVSDVRVALRTFRDQMIENIENGFENPHSNLNLN